MRQINPFAVWFARTAVSSVLIFNLTCAGVFILSPQDYMTGFEVAGPAGAAIVRGFGILFLMWNVPYPLVVLHPDRRGMFLLILIQQAIGWIGETCLWFSLPVEHSLLRATGFRFILFDGGGLIAMGAAFLVLIRMKTGVKVR